ncbi:choice-of-anchor L domain-containing protein [Cochlodiniinecator piscidefendens]|uniref:choice-of-anchor L domain-containing protein n=1 Tax=Cochlodiniinecator piscidefendens TaxID=2715756 RepID=UPI00140E0B3C|nr:choice-of-anchor L domain-containing protein [Cochlodiniinecator piscidefendens]
MPVASELPIDTSATADDMANAMFGSGIDIQSASYTGATGASGIYSDGDATAPGVTPSDTGVILSTGNATSITNSSGDVNSSASTSTNHGLGGDSDLTGIAGAATYDAAVFEADFIPQGSVLTMQVTFSSEEYLEYVDSGFNDAVGVWVNGVQATLTVGDGDISIDNINDTSNQNLYIDNPSDDEVANTEMDGFTVTMTLKAPVTPGEVNHIKIGIADSGDGVYDSNLMIAGDSVQTALIATDDDIEVNGETPGTFDILDNDASSVAGALTITMINGQPVTAGDTVTLSTGEMITLNADGTITAVSDGDDETNTFSYTVTDADGNTDVGFVNLTTIPCFVAGTYIKTRHGPRLIEDLCAGDKIVTQDHGQQTLRWIGQSTRKACGDDAPIVINANTFGTHDEIEISANHRVLLNSATAELLFGSREVLVKAKDLINDTAVRRRADGKEVRYFHLLFDQHEIITANGLLSESYHPGQQTLDSFDSETRDEILRLMPQVDALTGDGYGPTARVTLRSFESRALLKH